MKLRLVRPSIGEALADDTGDRGGEAFKVTKLAGVVAVVELTKVAMQVRLADGVIRAGDAALEKRKEVLGGVDEDETGKAGILVRRVVDGGWRRNRQELDRRCSRRS